MRTLSGTAAVERVRFGRDRTTVYNLSVSTDPSYLIGDDGVWVHNCPTFRKLFIETFEASGRRFPANHQVHHRIPQEHRVLFPGGEVDQLDNWVGLPEQIHREINGKWNSFRARYKNPTADHVRTFVMWIDANYGHQYLRP